MAREMGEGKGKGKGNLFFRIHFQAHDAWFVLCKGFDLKSKREKGKRKKEKEKGRERERDRELFFVKYISKLMTSSCF